MKKAIIILISIGWIACSRDDIQEPANRTQPQNMADLIISDRFNYSTSHSLNGSIQVKDLDDRAMSGIRVSIYDQHPDFGGSLLNSGITNSSGVFSPFGAIPSYLTEVVVICHAAGFPNIQEVPVSMGTLNSTFGGSAHKAVNSSGKSSSTSSVSSAGGNCYYMSTFNYKGVPNNFLAVNDPIDQSFLNMVNNSLPERAPVPSANPHYLATGNSTDIRITQNADVWITFVHEGAGYRNTLGYFVYETSNPPVSTSDIDSIFIALPNASFNGSGGGLYSGNKIHLGQFGPNTSIGWVLFQNAWNGSNVNVGKQRFYSNPDFNPESSSSLRQHNVQLFDNARDVILIGFEDLHRESGSDEDFNDLIFYVSANPITSVETINIPSTTENAPDSDGDGVVDPADDYPNDANKAFNNWAFGTLAFEDMWPLQGDYDFNDLVVGYEINQLTNGDGSVTEISMDLEVRAIGAANTNALAFLLGDLTPSDILSISGSHINGTSGTQSGSEPNQSKAVIVAIDDVYNFLERPEGAFFNTLDFKPSEAFKSITIDIELSAPKSPSSIGLPPFNAFIIPEGINGTQLRREVHLPGYPPSDLVDNELFGTADDNTNISNQVFYKTVNNLPWAMNISSTEYDHVIEYEPIINAYHHFATWAQSSGGDYNDWYFDLSGYRDNTKIFY